jgi:hypothetical protein
MDDKRRLTPDVKKDNLAGILSKNFLQLIIVT